jgi:hypothetical protein
LRVGELQFHQAHGHENRRERVVQVVCDTTRQDTKAFHALGAEKLLFEFFCAQ